MNKVLVGGLAVVMLAGGVIALATGYRLMSRSQPVVQNVGSESVKYEFPAKAKEGWIKDFELLERNGGTVRSQDLRGAVYVVNFFFTSCPHSCWQLNNVMKEVHDEFADDGAKFLSITCDAKNDTPAVLRTYADRLTEDQDNWLFLTGHPDYIHKVSAEMYEETAVEGSHNDRLVLVDQYGNVTGKYHFRDEGEMILLRKKIKELLATEYVPERISEDEPPEPSANADDGARNNGANNGV